MRSSQRCSFTELRCSHLSTEFASQSTANLYSVRKLRSSRSMLSSVSALGAVPYDHEQLLYENYGDCAVLCTWERALFHESPYLWNAMLSLMKQVPRSKIQDTEHDNEFRCSGAPFELSDAARSTGNNRSDESSPSPRRSFMQRAEMRASRNVS